jgi:hypothetical protein
MGELHKAGAAFDAAVTLHAESKDTVTAAAVKALALAAREFFPNAVTLHFEDSDQGDYLTMHHIVLRDRTGDVTTVDWDDVEFEELSDHWDHASSWLYPVTVPGWTWEQGKRGTIDAHIDIEEALRG